MKVLTKTLTPEESRRVYHVSGELLIEAEEVITPEILVFLLQQKVEEVYVPSSDDDESDIQFNGEHQPLSLESAALSKEGTINQDVFSRSGELLLEGGTRWGLDLRDSLLSKGEHFVFLKRKNAEELKAEGQKLRSEIQKLIPSGDTVAPAEIAKIELDIDETANLLPPGAPISVSNVEQALNNTSMTVELEGTPLRDRMKEVDVTKPRAKKIKKNYVQIHSDAVATLRSSFQMLQNGEDVDASSISSVAKGSLQALIHDKDLLMNTVNITTDNPHDQLFYHSFNSTVVAINIGTSIGYCEQQVFELALSAFLHDVGMLKVPLEIVTKPGELSQNEKTEIYRHPIHGINILQQMRNIPAVAPLVAYQVHERGDRTGYPKKKSDNTIHDFSKIVAVADVYAAMISERPYRKAYKPYIAIEYIIREGVSKRLSPDMIKALLKFASLYPLGSWVRLSDASVGKVIHANREQMGKPVVKLFLDKNGESISDHVVVDLSQSDLQVKDTIDGQRLGVETMEGF